tara:strand:+ start:457 stop:969 length:513 start_codon:yes stop_codon:yes gene_type:complete
MLKNGNKWHIECLRKLYNLPVSVLRKKACNRKQRRMLKVIMAMSVVLSMSSVALAEVRLIPIDSKSFRKCVSCHTIDEGGKNKMGPNLWNIMNRGIGQMENYKYSKKFSAWAGKNTMWTPELMDQWLTKSRSMVKGTRMNFREKRESKRAATIEYLKSMGATNTERGMIP